MIYLKIKLDKAMKLIYINSAMKKRGRKVKDLSKVKFGKLQPLYDTGKRKGKSGSVIWLCKCDCGNLRNVATKELTFGRTKSCGCLRRSGDNSTVHARLYQIWLDMKTRCYNTKSPKYKSYGQRGITVCSSWKNNFTSFKNWALKNGYESNLTIDKVNNNKGYSPNNCQWITGVDNIKKYWNIDRYKNKE